MVRIVVIVTIIFSVNVIAINSVIQMFDYSFLTHLSEEFWRSLPKEILEDVTASYTLSAMGVVIGLLRLRLCSHPAVCPGCVPQLPFAPGLSLCLRCGA